MTTRQVVLPRAEPVPLAARCDFINAGEKVFSHLGRFAVYRRGAELLAVDWATPTVGQRIPMSHDCSVADQRLAELVLSLFIPPVLDIRPIVIGARPQDINDVQFWQYPCATEKQALDNHRDISVGANVDSTTRTVNTYLGLPWATYIDKKMFPQAVPDHLAPRIRSLSVLAERLGYRLAVHTVCQQIYWRRLVGEFQALHVTDLHISHATEDINPQREGWSFRIHSWPLFAPNIEVPERRAGLTIGKPLQEKRFLASFIGAHMPHYRSDVRLRLADAAKVAARDDVLVELGNEWHFNKVVYEEQVQHKLLLESETQAIAAAAKRYNEVLSDSIFSLCPEGAGPNTLRVWESLAVGAIPVVLTSGWVIPEGATDGVGMGTCCVFAETTELSTLFERLARVPLAERQRMQSECLALYQSTKSCMTW
jgi:hypothetical protein